MRQNIAPSIFYAGVDDLDSPLFENQYALPHGMSYNSYVIVDRDIAVMDSVEHGKADEWIARVEEAAGGREPRYLIAHHVEPDHSASITRALDRWPGATLVGSAKALSMLTQFFPGYDFTGRTLAVGEGSELPLGSHTLTFLAAPMVHWPEVLVSYERTTRTLFSADAFGKFGALACETSDWTPEARRYYCNIVGKYGPQVRSLLSKASRLDTARICPLHGPVLEGDFSRQLDLYNRWSGYEPEEQGVLVAYATIYGGTRRAALMLADSLRRHGVAVETVELRPGDLSEAVSQAFRFSAMALAAPTYDASLFPPMHDFIHHLQLKGLRSRTVGLIENGTWAPVAARLMAQMIGECRDMTVVEPRVTVRSAVDPESAARIEELALALAREVKKV